MSVVFGQLHHALLHDIEGRFLIADMVDRAFEGPFLNALEEFGEFLFCSQKELRCVCSSARAELARRPKSGAWASIIMTSGRKFEVGLLGGILQCDNAPCKSNGKRVKARRIIRCVYGFGLKFRGGLTRVIKGAPKVFR